MRGKSTGTILLSSCALVLTLLFTASCGSGTSETTAGEAKETAAEIQKKQKEEEKKAVEKKKAEKEEAEKKKAEEESKPETTVRNGTDIDTIECVSIDKSGITLKLRSDHNNIMVIPKRFEVAGQTYEFLGADEELNPQVHFRADGSQTDNISLDMQEGTDHEAKISIDGVNDYTHFKMTIDNTIYYNPGEKGGRQTYPIKDVSCEIITE